MAQSDKNHTLDPSRRNPGQHYRVLLADDDTLTRQMLKHFLTKAGFLTLEAVDGKECISVLEKEAVDVLLLDISMPKKDGFDVMNYLRKKNMSPIVIMVTTQNDIPNAVKCIKMDAYEYLVKPLDPEKLLIVIKNALNEYVLNTKLAELKKELQSKEIFRTIIGESDAIKHAMEHAMHVMTTNLNVLIIGESGVGKELFAHGIHMGSTRKNGPFVSVNCAAISHELAESLLFGHTKGSFTGAHGDHQGFFEQADGGTLFLDEIGDMDADIQAKVLRAIQEKKIRRVGEKKERSIDFRLISATNRDFKQTLDNNSFRGDLYYRLEEFPLFIPPLRERKGDIQILANHFLDEFCCANQLNRPTITADAIQEMLEYDWPGNIRELKNAIQRTAISNQGKTAITSVIHNQSMQSLSHTNGKKIPAASVATTNDRLKTDNSAQTIQSLDETERRAIEDAYHACGKNPTKTAQVLGIGRATLYRKLKKLGLN